MCQNFDGSVLLDEALCKAVSKNSPLSAATDSANSSPRDSEDCKSPNSEDSSASDEVEEELNSNIITIFTPKEKGRRVKKANSELQQFSGTKRRVGLDDGTDSENSPFTPSPDTDVNSSSKRSMVITRSSKQIYAIESALANSSNKNGKKIILIVLLQKQQRQKNRFSHLIKKQ